MAEQVTILQCEDPNLYGWSYRALCGQDRDCVPYDEQHRRLDEIICGSKGWLSKHPTRTIEIFPDFSTQRAFKLTSRFLGSRSMARCEARGAPGELPGLRAPGSDPFTISIPTVTDILRLPGIESDITRKERAARMMRANPGLPEPLRWVPKILNKLDDAQDILYTGLVLARPLLRRAASWLIPGLGVLLTLNDILNLLT